MKILKILLSLLLITVLSSCKSSSTLKDGVFEGVGKGRGGDIKVSVTLADATITDVVVLSHGETQGFDKAMDTLKQLVLSQNSIAVDKVSGATLTSNGYLEAIENAIKAAGGTVGMLKKVSSTSTQTTKKVISETVDVVVIGGGGAGFAAAIEAKKAGANVILIEKMHAVGGNTLISGAEYAAPANWIQAKEGIVDSPDLMYGDVLKGGDNKNNPELVRVLADKALDGAIWLRDECNVIWEEELMFFGGHSVKRSLIPLDASGVEIIKKMSKKAEELKIKVYVDTKAVDLITKDGAVVGVKAEGKDNDYEFTAKSTIITTGGFGSNLEMRIKYNKDMDEKILSTNTVGSTGDGIILAEKVGANLVGMEYIQTYPICDPLTGTLLYFDDARLYGHTVIVNLEGKRFVEELGRRDVMSMAIKNQTGSACYEIVDQNGFDNSKLLENHGPEIQYLYDNKLLVKADTLDGVAEFFGINKDNFKETIKNYNSYVDAKSDPEFNKRSLPSKVDTGPYYMIKAVPAVHHTMGGIEINTNAEVISTEGKVIPGLYAAGEVTGGVHGSNRLGSDALADIIVFGRIAGINASK